VLLGCDGDGPAHSTPILHALDSGQHLHKFLDRTKGKSPTCNGHPGVKRVVGLLVYLRADRLRGGRVDGAGVIPRERVGGASGRRSRTGGRVAADEAHGRAVADPGVRRARGRPDRPRQTVREIGAAARSRTLPNVLHRRRRHHRGVAVLVGAALRAVRLRVGGAVVDGVLLAVRRGGVELAGRRHRCVVRAVLGRPGLVQRVVVVVLAGGVRRHAQAERERSVGGRRRRRLLMVVGPRDGAGALVVVAAVEAALLEVGVHGRRPH
jgi:hypothetical protein